MRTFNEDTRVKIPATFHTNMIELPSISEQIIKKLNELGIKFNNK